MNQMQQDSASTTAGNLRTPTHLRETAPASRVPAVTFRHPAWLTVFASIALSIVGVFCINLTAGVDAVGLSPLAKKQAVFCVAGLLAAAILTVPHYRLLSALTPLLIAASIASLVFVLLPFAPEALVTPRNGARRWINLGIFDAQPSEIAKIVYVLAMAKYLRRRRSHRTLRGLLPPAIITFVPVALILVEPDLGTSLLFIPALLAMLVAAGARLQHIIVVAVIGLAMAPATYPILKPHQKKRIDAMVNQLLGEVDTEDVNYQSYKAMTLIGAGETTGMHSELSRAVIDFNNLPEDHNDMVYAVVVNRFGAIGGAGLMALYGIWLLGAGFTAAMCRDAFGRIVIVGLSAMIAAQAFVNIGMNLGALPITGMTLPFVSYGGSSLIAAYLTVGLLVSIAMRRPGYLARRSFEFEDSQKD